MSREMQDTARSIPHIATRVIMPFTAFIILVFYFTAWDSGVAYSNGEIGFKDAIEDDCRFVLLVAAFSFPVFSFVIGGFMMKNIKRLWHWFTMGEYVDKLEEARKADARAYQGQDEPGSVSHSAATSVMAEAMVQFVAEGFAQGFARGKAEAEAVEKAKAEAVEKAKARLNAEWRSFLDRQAAAAERGDHFDEDPPDSR